MSDTEQLHIIQQKFQRDINRMSESDRNTRKRGLIKLLEGLPWDNVKESGGLRLLCRDQLFAPLLVTVSDPVEKCRETSLALLKKVVVLCSPLDQAAAVELCTVLCRRINEIPYPENGEELRLQITELLLVVLTQPVVPELLHNISEAILPAVSKALVDSFPAVKRVCCDIIELFTTHVPESVRTHLKVLLKGLDGNASHQHHRVRSASIAAIGNIIACIAHPLPHDTTHAYESTYLTTMRDIVLPVLSKTSGDRSANPRLQSALLCGKILGCRIAWGTFFDPNETFSGNVFNAPLGNNQRGVPPGECNRVDIDTEVLSVLVMLMGDPDDNVRKDSMKILLGLCEQWVEYKSRTQQESLVVDHSEPMEVEASVAERSEFLNLYASFVLDALSRGVLAGWTVDARLRFLRAINALIIAVENICESQSGAELVTGKLLPQLLQALSNVISDEDSDIRHAAQSCTNSIGRVSAAGGLSLVRGNDVAESPGYLCGVLDYVAPRVKGEVAGMDTAHHRTTAMLLLTEIMAGVATIVPENYFENSELCTFVHDAVVACSVCLACPSLYEFREPTSREAALLLTRGLAKHFPATFRLSDTCQGHLVTALIYLSGRCSGEDTIIPTAAKRELEKVVGMIFDSTQPGVMKPVPTSSFVGKYFSSLLGSIISHPISVGVNESPVLSWKSDSAHRAAFEALVRECPQCAWQHCSIVLDKVIFPLVKPRPPPPKGSVEEAQASYAAQRGEVDDSWGDVDIRLSMLALLEGMLRAGNSDWECGKYISENCDALMHKALIPNLVWRAGRVEGVARKVTLTATHGLLKAGAVAPEALYKCAPQLVPLLASDLDDSDSTARHLGCVCLTIVFERLRGGFGEQAVHELYPKLMKRLDDSEDTIRMAVCATLKSFLMCAAPPCYKGTMIDYTLDQLFIHLDDTDPNIQREVYEVIMIAAEHIDAQLVVKKAKSNMQSHRTPVMCETVIKAIEKLA